MTLKSIAKGDVFFRNWGFNLPFFACWTLDVNTDGDGPIFGLDDLSGLLQPYDMGFIQQDIFNAICTALLFH